MSIRDYKMVLIRGPQGSGKSTFAKTVFPDHALLEDDDYFMIGANYSFDHSALTDARKWCQWRAFKAYDKGIPVVVANTFARIWEMEPYLSIASRSDMLVVRMNTQFQNIHSVPEHVVQAIRDRMEDFAGELPSSLIQRSA